MAALILLASGCDNGDSIVDSTDTASPVAITPPDRAAGARSVKAGNAAKSRDQSQAVPAAPTNVQVQ